MHTDVLGADVLAHPQHHRARGVLASQIVVEADRLALVVNDRAAHHWSQVKLKTQAGFFQRPHWRTGSAPRLAFSQPAILVRSVVPSSNFPESGCAAEFERIVDATAFDLDLTGADTVWFSTGNLLNATDPCPPVGPTPNGPATDFARDIAPLFRQIGIDHMGPIGQNIVDLSSPADVRDHIDDIIAVLRAKRMPPDKPWRPDKIALLEQWRTDNFPPIGPT
jgi:hypothetical protein